ncbi:hypothetical protein PQQ52_29590 [Paraburkholderia sediminicola]|uniref:hypothetical protein n=1 Tax=Paraburkholderia sediminicola TaxID=458836 RepID=UPI0038B89761
MNAGIADRRRIIHNSDVTSSSYPTIPPTLARRCGGARASRKMRMAFLLGFAAILTLRVGGARAQDSSMLDERVTQESVGETICRPGYADTVAPPFDELMAHRDRMLAARGINAGNGPAFALDRRVPIVLGGSPDAPSNLDLLPWAGQQGERRKARAAVMLKRCVCEGKLSLAEAQAAIVGNWSVVYSGFSQTSCDVSRLDVATGDSNGRGDGRDSAP